MDIMAPNEITSIVGMNLATAGWILVFLGIVGVLVLEQFIAALCSPIFFNTLDTPLPMLTQSLNRFLTFPSIVQKNFQDTQHVAVPVACEEYEEISVSDLSATGRNKGGDQVEIVRFQEILERNKRPSSDEREQA